MESCRTNGVRWLALGLCLGSAGAYAASATFPQKPITLVVASNPGSGSDITARLAAQTIGKYKFLPQPINVENKPGGSMCVATAYVTGKKRDPYFLMASTVTQVLNPLRGQCPIAPTDMTPIANLSFDDALLVVNVNSKFKTINELVNHAKTNPETVMVGGHMFGSITSIETYLLEKTTGIKLKYVSFGSGDPLTALLGGHVDFASAQPVEALELIKAKKIRPLGVLTEKRLQHLPDVPTLKEQGINVVGVGLNRGIIAPKDIPQDARKMLETAFYKFSQTEEYKKFHRDNALTEGFMDGPTFAKWMDERGKAMQGILKEIGLQKKP
jgi:putative tricarboxylic transport membrane protein